MTSAEIAPASEEQARALTNRIKAAVEGAWLLVTEAYRSRAWEALGYESWDEYCAAEFDGARLQLPKSERLEVVAEFREAGMSTRAIGSALGVDHATVVRDLRATPEPVQRDLATGASAPVADDADAKPDQEEASTVTGVNGKTYRAKPAGPRQRASLPPQFVNTAAALGKVIARFERLAEDDRYRSNRDAITAQCAPEIRRAVQVLGDLLLDLTPEKETH